MIEMEIFVSLEESTAVLIGFMVVRLEYRLYLITKSRLPLFLRRQLPYVLSGRPPCQDVRLHMHTPGLNGPAIALGQNLSTPPEAEFATRSSKDSSPVMELRISW